ncbi:hypothetical protein BerOc1_02904 [Pseudodesulfovibrio hydrargyri]|jgi:hypothetical protein|uniref:Uncharacterized protein n=1 Tax=Pseudodesulfovibrio hydrargyri TaxID=2125990 RepID=A0A1J5NCK5_9BACT|nr:hypothetical protein [Pseudodesulfovibrio hydrargyri]OIQ50959.1 hypothetical protein BerOc1_02904 [Pseudodesulfovibrio hydrargyri]
MSPEDIFQQFQEEFKNRKFIAGLLIAFIDLFLHLEIHKIDANSLDELFKTFPQVTELKGGRRANTLIVEKEDGTQVSVRKFYDEIERFFLADKKRFDYPKCAPHATQAWGDYVGWLNSLARFDEKELTDLRKQIVDYVLGVLKSHAFDPASISLEPPVFKILLTQFDFSARKGEPTGAGYQGVVFGFLRADNPHLQIEIEKVRTGSKRLQRIGDIDGWEGKRLAISAEVKHFHVQESDIPDFASFANEVTVRGAIGMIVALGFEKEAEDQIIEMGLFPLDIRGMLTIVNLWDPLKQRTAMSSFEYYANHVEKNASLSERIKNFLDGIKNDIES